MAFCTSSTWHLPCSQRHADINLPASTQLTGITCFTCWKKWGRKNQSPWKRWKAAWTLRKHTHTFISASKIKPWSTQLQADTPTAWFWSCCTQPVPPTSPEMTTPELSVHSRCCSSALYTLCPPPTAAEKPQVLQGSQPQEVQHSCQQMVAVGQVSCCRQSHTAGASGPGCWSSSSIRNAATRFVNWILLQKSLCLLSLCYSCNCASCKGLRFTLKMESLNAALM